MNMLARQRIGEPVNKLSGLQEIYASCSGYPGLSEYYWLLLTILQTDGLVQIYESI